MGFVEIRLGGARVVFTDRHGGTSKVPYDTANLGLLTDDDADRVRENRRLVGAMVGGSLAHPDRWFRIRQVHGTSVVHAERVDPGAAPDADAAVTATSGLPLTVLTADCAPVALVADTAVAAVHAGWRGLAGGVIQATAAELRTLDDGPVRAVLGPCIHPERYEFGAHDLDTVAARLGPGVRARTAGGGAALDLRAAVRAALEKAAITELTDVDVCTAASPDHFSFRRDGPTGRQAMLVVREP
jgi:polyphenol oxidase